MASLVESRRCPYMNVQGKNRGKVCNKVGTVSATLLHGTGDPTHKDIHYCNTHYIRLAGRMRFGGRQGRASGTPPSYQELFSPVKTEPLRAGEKNYIQLKVKHREAEETMEKERKKARYEEEMKRKEEAFKTSEDEEDMDEDSDLEEGEIREKTTHWGNIQEQQSPLVGWSNPYGGESQDPTFSRIFSAIKGASGVIDQHSQNQWRHH